ncbi:hypothetical protein DTO021D3_4901 [Paecilomyces variotii]|nr:hypothetical protein DTO032I3_1682 [Paecilomyces variotii]KAJ9278167.1 hypothetical protein DTO021D3_4901 [Paecilomyces variotii]KAJ9345531.1 hypothetical protein DTO027B6_2062 [Paecilomyces variotii]KAJ9381585.1 hypothetical protein DTO032I4_6148 [Paecilomyces variotii]
MGAFRSLFLLFWITAWYSSLVYADNQVPLRGAEETQPKRIAVIGAGSGGASTAHFLRKYADYFKVPVNITVYERASYVGGRSTTVNVFDDPSIPVELGASIFVEVNRNLVKAAKEFGLLTETAFSARPRDSDDSLGVWDSQQFVYQQQDTSFWWNIAKLLWKYGLAPVRTQRLMKQTVNKFLGLYESPLFPFSSLSDAANAASLLDATASTGAEFLERNGVSADFAREIIQASTRVNYGQNLPLIHGLETMVCMAAEGAISIQGGNWRIFDAMLKASGAEVRLNTSVASINQKEDGTLSVSSTTGHSAAEQSEFDEVVIAGPLQEAGLTISPELDHVPDRIPYVELHVTLFASPHRISPQYFNSGASSVPETILTTLPQGLDLGSRRDGVGPTGFWSISTLQKVKAPSQSEEHYVYKIFSPQRLSAQFVADILGLDREAESTKAATNHTIGDLPREDVSWFHEKTWHSYPYLYPRVTFEEISLAPHIWYTSGIESFISTMETSSLMGKNVAALIARSWLGKPDQDTEKEWDRWDKAEL